MGLEELNQQVTTAILRADSLPSGSVEAAAAFATVSCIEEGIAEVTEPRSVEGEIARIGAVLAALSAGDRERAGMLAHTFMGEVISPAIRERLQGLLDGAEDET